MKICVSTGINPITPSSYNTHHRKYMHLFCILLPQKVPHTSADAKQANASYTHRKKEMNAEIDYSQIFPTNKVKSQLRSSEKNIGKMYATAVDLIAASSAIFLEDLVTQSTEEHHSGLLNKNATCNRKDDASSRIIILTKNDLFKTLQHAHECCTDQYTRHKDDTREIVYNDGDVTVTHGRSQNKRDSYFSFVCLDDIDQSLQKDQRLVTKYGKRTKSKRQSSSNNSDPVSDVDVEHEHSKKYKKIDKLSILQMTSNTKCKETQDQQGMVGQDETISDGFVILDLAKEVQQENDTPTFDNPDEIIQDDQEYD